MEWSPVLLRLRSLDRHTSLQLRQCPPFKLTVLRIAIFYPPEFLGTARRLVVVEFIPYSSDEPSAITFSAVFDTLALAVVSVVFVGSSVSRRSQTFGQIPPVMYQVRSIECLFNRHPYIMLHAVRKTVHQWLTSSTSRSNLPNLQTWKH